jgi:iron complex outermembrane receptor protein
LYGHSRATGRLLLLSIYTQSLVLVMLLTTPMRVVMAAGAGRIQFDISPGPAQRALLQFSDQSNINVEFSAEDVQGSYTNGVDGFMEPRGALSRLLDGTSLCPVFTSSGKSVSVRRCSKSGEASSVSPAIEKSVVVTSIQVRPSPMETVPVTGTNIHGVKPRGVDVMVISRRDFLQNGIRTTAELFARLPELAGANPLGPRAEGNSGLGVAADLRGQGAAATLVLLNGHRLAGSGDQGAFQDVANIPLSAIERVEIVLDGASAQYGSDAVGGVVNLITLAGDQQSQVTAQIDEGVSSRFQQALVSQVIGGDWESGAAVAAMEYIHATTWKGPDLVTPQTAPIVDRVPGKELASTYIHLEERFPSHTEFTAEGIYTHRREGEQYDTALAPAIPDASVSERTGVSVQMTYLSAESKTAVTDDGVLVVSLNRATETQRQRIWPVGAVEFANGTTEDALTAGVAPTWFSMFSRTDQLSIKFDNSVLSYPAGTLKALLGGEYRCQTFNTLDSTRPPEFPGRYRRRVSATFGELHIPLAGEGWSPRGIHELELSIAGRYEQYSDFRGRYTPQYWLRWVPWRGIEMRGSWGRSSQVPNLPSLDTSRNSIVLTPVADSQSPTGQSDALVESGNSSALTGQTATTVSLGMRFDWPLSDSSYLNAELNAFRIHFYDRIQSPDLAQVQLDDPRYGPLINRDVTMAQRQQLCLSKQFFGTPGDCLTDPIAAVVDLTLKNIDSLSTRGLDVRGDWSADFGGWRAEIDIRGVYFRRFEEKITPNASAVSLLRTERSPAEFQLSSLFSIKRGAAEFGILIHCSSGFLDESIIPPHDVPGWTTVDLQAKYNVPDRFGNVLRNAAIVLTARNVADRPLPVLNDASVNQSYDLLSGLAVRRLLSFAFQKRL